MKRLSLSSCKGLFLTNCIFSTSESSQISSNWTRSCSDDEEVLLKCFDTWTYKMVSLIKHILLCVGFAETFWKKQSSYIIVWTKYNTNNRCICGRSIAYVDSKLTQQTKLSMKKFETWPTHVAFKYLTILHLLLAIFSLRIVYSSKFVSKL